MRAKITLFRAGAGLVVALVATCVILLKIPSGYYLLLPDVAHPVAPLVHIAGGKPSKKGELFFVDVHELKASKFDILFQWIHPHSTRVPESALIPPGSSDRAYNAAALRQMATSQRVAAAVALRYLGYHVVIRQNGVLVNQIVLDTGAAGTLQPTDVILAVNGRPTLTVEALRAVMAEVKPGQTVTVRVLRGKRVLTVRIRTVDQGGRALLGIAPAQSATITLPLKVAIDADGIGGPSAGLAFALEVIRKLGRDVTHGYSVAATGQMNLDGTVSPIGGAEQKTWGVREAHAQVFLVPAGDNARVARKYGGPDLRVIPVTSLEQALDALAALPKLP